jgi:hypothetical protein
MASLETPCSRPHSSAVVPCKQLHSGSAIWPLKQPGAVRHDGHAMQAADQSRTSRRYPLLFLLHAEPALRLRDATPSMPWMVGIKAVTHPLPIVLGPQRS